MSSALSSKAEDLRQEIKALVAQATPKSETPEDVVAQATPELETPEEYQQATFTENMHGDKIYEGKLFAEKVSRLINEMGLGKGWGWSLAHLSQSRPIANKFSRMYLVSLSEGARINPGGNLREGCSHLVTDKPILSSHSTIIFVIPIREEYSKMFTKHIVEPNELKKSPKVSVKTSRQGS